MTSVFLISTVIGLYAGIFQNVIKPLSQLARRATLQRCEFVKVEIKEGFAFPVVDITLHNSGVEPALITAVEFEVLEEQSANTDLGFHGLPCDHVYDVVFTRGVGQRLYSRSVAQVIPPNDFDRFQVMLADYGTTAVYTDCLLKLRASCNKDVGSFQWPEPIRVRIYHGLEVARVERPGGLSLPDRVKDLDSTNALLVRDAAIVLGIIEIENPSDVSSVSMALKRVFDGDPAFYDYDKDHDDLLREYSGEDWPMLGAMYESVLLALMRSTKTIEVRDNIDKLPQKYRRVAQRSWLQALSGMGKTGVHALIEALNNKDDELRSVAARGLRDVADHIAVPALQQALKDESKGVRERAAEALARRGAIDELRRSGTPEARAVIKIYEHQKGASDGDIKVPKAKLHLTRKGFLKP